MQMTGHCRLLCTSGGIRAVIESWKMLGQKDDTVLKNNYTFSNVVMLF
jgi:hypothetical protein